LKYDAVAKSRHAGLDPASIALQQAENCGFRVEPGMTKNRENGLFARASDIEVRTS